MLEAEFHHAEDAKHRDAAVSRVMRDVLELPQDTDGTVSNDYMQQRRTSFVSFGTFLEEYWSHFSGTKGLGACLDHLQQNAHHDGGATRSYPRLRRVHGSVPSKQLMSSECVTNVVATGVIKGSEEALAHPEGYLDMESYCKLSHRTQATFASQRENIYSLFQAYLKKKKERGDYDAADRSATLLRACSVAWTNSLSVLRTRALIDSMKTIGVPGQEVDFM